MVLWIASRKHIEFPHAIPKRCNEYFLEYCRARESDSDSDSDSDQLYSTYLQFTKKIIYMYMCTTFVRDCSPKEKEIAALVGATLSG